MAKLVIVESPGKVKAIQSFLGRNYTVQASVGHVRDLPKSRLGIDLENDFEPQYITIRGKGETVKKLRASAAEADSVLLATDPDREGEAISWHLATLLNIPEDRVCRIEFNEITKNAVKDAVKHPRTIDMNLVNAQQARREIDRLVGYSISPLLWSGRRGLSAGRVQSVTAKLVCDREREIAAFVPEEYWSLTAEFTDLAGKHAFKADLTKRDGKKYVPKSERSVNNVLKELQGASYAVSKVETGKRIRKPQPPFTTSTLQQEASKALGMTPSKTMQVAQSLYEGVTIKGQGTVGLITYMRTDSVRSSAEAVELARKMLTEAFGNEYIPSKPNVYKGKSNAQDAHEAIRPTHLEIKPTDAEAALSRDQFRLYRLIYNRFMASQMKPAEYDTMAVDILGGRYTFHATGSKLVFPGYLKVYEEVVAEGKEQKLPALAVEQPLLLKEFVPGQHFTTPPARYTEASLVKAMEELGIGRPSTYASTVATIIAHGYVAKDKKSLVATELGMKVNDWLCEHFPEQMKVDFTADMEESLDEIAEGKVMWKELIRSFYPGLAAKVEQAKGTPMVIPEEVSDVICEKCGANMVVKMSRYGKFLACPNYPNCSNTKPIVKKIGVKCPKCGGDILEKHSRKGNKLFYGCERFPQCDFTSWDKPSDKPCSKCGGMTVIKFDKKGYTLECTKCGNKERHKNDN